MKTVRTGHKDAGKHIASFGIKDAKGRNVGAIVWYSVQVYEPTAPDSYTYCNIEAGTWYAMRPSITRNGDSFGATQPQQFFRTIDECKEAGLAYIKRAAKRNKAAAVYIDFIEAITNPAAAGRAAAATC